MQPKPYLIMMDIYKGVLNPQTIEFVTEDNGQCVFNIEMYYETIQKYDLTGSTLRLLINGQQQDCEMVSASEGKAKINLKQSLFSISGVYTAELQIYDSTNNLLRLTTPQFRYMVRKSLMDDTTVQADPNYSILQKMIIDVTNADTTATQALAKANEALGKTADFNQAVADVNQLKTDLMPLHDEITNKIVITDTKPSPMTDNTYFFKRNSKNQIMWIEDSSGNRYGVGIEPNWKTLTMGADGTFPTTKVADWYSDRYNINGNTYVYKAPKGTQNWVKIEQSEVRDTTNFDYKLSSVGITIGDKTCISYSVNGVTNCFELPQPLRKWDKIENMVATIGTKELTKNDITNLQLQSVNSYNVGNFLIVIPIYKGVDINTCNILKNQTSTIANTTESGYFFAGDNSLYIRLKDITTVDVAKKWLQDNNFQLQYQLAQPTSQEIKSTFQITPDTVGSAVIKFTDAVTPSAATLDVAQTATQVSDRISALENAVLLLQSK